LRTIKIKKNIMKKLLLIAAIACFTFACNDGSKSSTTTTDTAVATPATAAPATSDSSATATTQGLKDGLMTLKDGKVLVLKGGAWVALDSTFTCTNGRKVSVNGDITKGDKKRKLEEGWKIDKDGQITDKDGKLVDTSGWD
jgi:uncharacterized cupredoxin-like copper-binding protein